MFRTVLAMNDPCPVCGLVFEREPGYFLGAMYFSYFMAVGITAPLFFLGTWLWPQCHQMLIALGALLLYLPLVPFVFRYSRVMWIHYDRLLAPSDLSDHQGWLEWRARQNGSRGPE
jgi:hypothetical protein